MGRRRRRRNRDAGPAADVVQKIVQPLWNMPPYEIATEQQLDLVHEKTMQILEQAGIAFYDDESCALLRAHGVDVDDEQVARFDRGLVMEYLAKAPASFTWSARNPANDVQMGDNHVVFAPVVGPPFVQDMERGRRDGVHQDLINFLKLNQMSPYLHCQGAEICVSGDVPIEYRHLELLHAHFVYGDKPMMGIYHTGPIAQDAVDLGKVVYGEEAFMSKHYYHGVVNVSSPRRLDDRMLGLMFAYGRANQIIDVTPFILSGAMGPTSILGTVAQLNAEALAGIVFMQMIRPGVPCVYGSFQAVIDLQSGAPVFGAPESQLALYLSGQLARRYNIPFRAAGAYASSKIPDAQAAYESVMAMFPSMLVRPNFILHAAGWLEAGLTAGYEKFVLDCEMLGMYQRYMQNVSWDDDEWAMDAILNEVPPGGHHLGTAHTMRHYKKAFYRADLFDYDSAEAWQANGSRDAITRANAKYKQILRDYKQPSFDPDKEAAIRAFIDQRKRKLNM
ncbi:MAG: trimethylamine methyltransferase family protein [Candidatus Promineifilaceae bacterium]